MDTKKPETTILTVKEAAERWKISYGSLVRMIHANEIPFIQIGKRSYRLREEDFIQAMTAARTKGPVEKLADMIRDFPAEDIWEMEQYAEFLASRREPKKEESHHRTDGNRTDGKLEKGIATEANNQKTGGTND